ncbi:MAG: DUF4399 domain-containing protein [Cryomorphaceae bacterium]|nr:DUF4399 domain-containing protein [Flavobacteriales bacterium]
MKKVFIAIISVAFLAACGETGNKSEQTTETKEVETKDEEGKTGMAEVPAVPENAAVMFANLEDSAEVTSPFYVEFGVEGMEVEPAGPINEGFGHHHIIIDGEFTPFAEAVPANETHIHYGGGQTGDTLTLDPGMHTLTLQFADGLHRSYGEQMSATISVNVK